MEEVSTIIPSDIDHFLENEKFDFDLPFSPTLLEEKIVDGKTTDDEDEVFFGPVGFTEQCMSTRVTTLHDDTTIKPLSPLSGEQVVELFTEATKIALHLERLSTETSETSLNQSHASSSKSSMSNSYVKLSNCSSSSSLSQLSVGKLSSDSSEGKPGSQSDLIDCDDKENAQPILKSMEGLNIKKNGSERVNELKESHVTPLALKHTTPVAKSKRCLPRPGSRSSRLPKSKNTEKSLSAFSSPIKTLGHDHSNGTANSDNLETCNVLQEKNQSVGKSERSQHTMQNSVSNKTTAATTKTRKTSSASLTKRNIFRSTDSLTEDETKETKSKLPVPEQSKIPGPKPRRRRSSSTSSVSSQSSTSSSKSHSALDESQSKPTRLAKQIPPTKASLASSLPTGLLPRSKAQENAKDKKTQPMKALPRSATKNIKNSKIEPPSSHLSRSLMRPPSDEIKEHKIPLAATPKSQSSLPVARRRSNIKRPSVSSTRSSESTPRRNSSSLTTDSQTPSKNGSQKAELTASQKRRSFIPTPGRNVQTPDIKRISRNSSEEPPISLSPATKPKKELSQQLLEPSQEPLESSQEPLERSQKPLEPSQELLESSQKPLGSSQKPLGSSQKPLGSSQKPLEPSQEPLKASQESLEPNLQEPSEPFLKMNDHMLQGNQHCINTCLTSGQSVDDLLQLDDIASCLSDVIPIQPKPVPQPDLIDLSGI